MGARNYAQFYALLRGLKGASKEQLVHEYTSGRTESLREMTDGEYRTMLRGLQRLSQHTEALRAARSAALKQLQRYGVDTTRWSEVDAFVLEPRIAGKLFARLSLEELEALTRKMRAILSKGERKGDAEAVNRFNAEAIYIHIKTQQPS